VSLAGCLLVGNAALSSANASDAYSVLQQDKRFRTWTKMIDVADLDNYARGKKL